ncbi:hypothetical protein BVU17_04440 [Haloarcula taiwanensis]|uniref:DUF7984 domain-containing protein n=1 Tax=Haloarcula taiwanensis TaxID=1932004 RepID=A0A2H4ZWG2_9EURY|nr:MULTISPECIES: hypothetical protein [Haloarcula]AUG46803.1 hypothetical protein BVU17_04440 [Haloarcula taiwanensis]RLM37007.1 hypothetical protein DVK01_10395 [Haloarcula sp. Atlit-120R]RLM44604.1 hypothetical protein DVK00_09065 [Haloarcula sp. Atlit-47R]RLN01491.1 hypothetical protein D3D01_01340 [Haloarcula sp. Atlit-7R]
MRLTPETVDEEYKRVQDRASDVVPLINDTRAHLGSQFGVDVDMLTDDAYTAAIDEVFADGDRAVNVAALVRLLRTLDVTGDYPGFVIDELLGRELAAMIAGEQPLRLLAEATFHVADVRTHGADTATAGADDLDAALAAGVQTRVPGWPWQQAESPFGVE